MLWAIISIGAVGLLWGLIAQIRIGGLRENLAKSESALELMTLKRDEYREGLHELKSELQKSGLAASRDLAVLKLRVDQCKADLNALPDTKLTRAAINARLDRLLQGEESAPRNTSNR